MKRKIWYLLIILTLLIPLSPATAAPDPAEPPPPPAQEQAAQSYLLQLAMPEVKLPAGAKPADVPGYYQAALYRQWTRVEGVLRALREIGLVEEYTLLPEANSFHVTARPEAAEQLEQLGALSEPRLMAAAAETEASSFQRRLDAAVQETQRQPALLEQPAEPPAEPAPPTPESYLVRLVPPDDPATSGEARHELATYLEWLKQTGEVAEYEWLPQAHAFRVSARSNLDSLLLRPEVESITPASDKALALAQQAWQEALEKATIAEKMSQEGGLGILAAGGPDAYGYSYIDSTEPGGPTYSWDEISGTGTELTPGWSVDDGYLGPIPVGFTFNFYGNDYTELYVGSNGYLSFGSGYGSIPWSGLPSTDAPNNDIMPFGGDMYIYGGTTHVYYQLLSSPDRFVVEFVDLQWCCGLNTSHTFEIVFYPDGRILVQYENLNGDMPYVAGIENSDGTVGLDYPAGNVTDGLAVLYSYTPPLLELLPFSQGKMGQAGETVVYTETVYNHFGVSDTYTLTVAGNSWDTTLWDITGTTPIASIGPVADGSSADFLIRVQIPSDASAGTHDTADIVASSWTSPSLQASAQVNTAVAQINVREYDTYVSGYVVPNSNVLLVLKDADGNVKDTQTRTSSSSGYFYNYFSVYIQSGDTVEVTVGDSTVSVYVPLLTALVDRDADTISGQAPADITSTDPITPPVLRIEARGVNHDSASWQTINKYITTDSSGNYASTVFTYTSPTTGTLDLRPPNTYGYLYYTNAQGNQVYLYYRAPMVSVQENGDWVGGYTENNATVTVTLKSGAGAVKGQFTDQADGNGGYFSGNLRDVYGNSIKSVAGDVVEMEASPIITVPVVPLTALADPVADTVTGQAPPDIASTSDITLPNLYVYNYDTWIMQYVTTTAASEYIANDVGDIDPGTDGATGYFNENGDSVYINFVTPIVYVRGYSWGYSSGNRVSGYASAANALVTLELERGGATIATAYDMSSSNGWFEANFLDTYGNAANIEADDTVKVTCGGATTTVDVPTLTADADPTTDVVSGTGPADVVTTTWELTHTLQVYVEWPSWTTLNVTTTHGGDYSADFSPYGGIDPGSNGWLRYVDAGGNYVYDDFQAPYEYTKPVVYARGYYDWWWGSGYYVAENYVGGYASGFCGYGTVTLRDSGGAVKAQATNVWACNTFGVSLYDVYGSAAAIEAGDTVEAIFGGQTTVVDVPEFDVTSDAGTDTVSGSTNATVVTGTYGLTQTLAVWPTSYYDWDYGKYVTTTVGGFTATNPFYSDANPANPPQTIDIYPGNEGHLRYVDADNNRVYARFQAIYEEEYAKPVVYVRGRSDRYYAENYVYIYNSGCGDVDVVLKDSGGTVKAETTVWACNWGSTYLYDVYGNSADIEAGDTVEATCGDQTTVVNVPSFDVTSDHVNDRVTGTTNATVVTDTYGLTQTLAVWPTSWYDWDYGKYVLPIAGAFTATNPFYWEANPFWGSANLDWGSGTSGHLRYVDADSNRVYARFSALYDDPQVWVQKDSNYVWGYVTQAGTTVTVTLKSGATTQATAFDISSVNGYFDVNFYDAAGNPVIIEEGDDVVVEASTPITIPVVHLTGQADVENDTVSGEGPANAQLNVVVDVNSQSAATDGSGAYSADFHGVYDIQPGNQVEVQHRNAGGHTVYIRFYAGPKLYAQLNSYYAWGYAPTASIPVTVTLKSSGGTVKGSDVTQSWGDNQFWAYLYNSAGQRAIIAAGDTLEVDFGGGNVVTMTVTGMTANVDADNDTVSGTGPADTPLNVEVGNFDQTVTTDGSGNWNADASGIEDITPGEQVLVRHANAGHNETWLYAVAPVVYVRATGSGSTDYQADNYLSGYAPNRAMVDITLKRGSAIVATRRFVAYGYYSTYLYDALGLTADIQGNDEIVVAASTPFTITVPDIQATVDAETDTVAGSGPADVDLGIYVNGSNQTVRTDASGVFTATFTSINPGDYAYVRHLNPDGHWIHARFRAVQTGTPIIYARWNEDDDIVCDNCVSGQAGVANTVVNIALKRGGTTVATTSDVADDWGNYSAAFTGAAGEPVGILSGDVIEAAASAPVTMTVAALTAQANRETGVLYGAGPANESLYYWYRYPWSCCWDGTRTIGPDGNYYFSLGFGSGASGYVRYTGVGGHRTYLGWAVPYAWVRENGNRVDGYVERGVPVTVRLLTSGGAERGTATTTSDSYNGYFWVNLLDAGGDPLIIQPNDTVVVEASPAITIPVVPLSAEADMANDRVTGTGPANEELGVGAGDCWRNVTTAADGSFTADVSDECDLKAGDSIGIYYWNDEGNQVYIWFHAALVRVNAVNDIVDGYATPNATVNLTLKRGGSTIATATASTDENGFFSAFFTDGSGNLVDVQPGDVVEVTASPTTSITVVDLSATVNPDTDTVSGSGPANATLLVKAFAWTGANWTSASKAAYTDGSGNFSAGFSGDLDLTGVSYAYVSYSDASGNQTGYTTTPSRSPLVDEVEQDVQGQGATVETSTFGAANGNDLTPPVVYQGGGGTLVFASEGGSLVLTRPDGSVDDAGNTLIVVDSAPSGLWKVQVRVWSGEGNQYAIAIGKAAHVHVIYLPLVARNFGP